MSPFREIGVFVDESNGNITRFGNGKLLDTGERRDFKNSTLTVVDDENLEVEIRRTRAEDIYLANPNPANLQKGTVTTLNTGIQIEHVGQKESLIIIPNDSSDPPLGYSLGYIYQWEEAPEKIRQ